MCFANMETIMETITPIRSNALCWKFPIVAFRLLSCIFVIGIKLHCVCSRRNPSAAPEELGTLVKLTSQTGEKQTEVQNYFSIHDILSVTR